MVKVLTPEQLEELVVNWSDRSLLREDPRLLTNLRFFSRDAAAAVETITATAIRCIAALPNIIHLIKKPPSPCYLEREASSEAPLQRAPVLILAQSQSTVLDHRLP